MKLIYPFAFAFALLALLIPTMAAQADEVVIYPQNDAIDEISESLSETVSLVLSDTNPCPECDGFAITDFDGYSVSVIGLTDTITTSWNADDNGYWFGRVDVTEILEGWSGTLYEPEVWGSFAEGEEDYYYLPYQVGTWALYGYLGPHNGDGSRFTASSGWSNVDLFSGDDRVEDGGYPNMLYASQTAEVEWTCPGEYNLAFKAGDFKYYHLVPNANIKAGDMVYRGHGVAELAKGTFSEKCGYAEQASNHWHVHWGFQVENGHFQVENWYLDIDSGQFTNMTNGDKVNYHNGVESLMAYWAGETPGQVPTPDPDDPYRGIPPKLNNDNLWSMLINWIIGSTDAVRAWFPDHVETPLAATFLNAAGVMIRIVFIMMRSNFNWFVTATVVTIIFVLESIRILIDVYLAIKKMIPFA